jgi:hypothetical protein
MSSDERRNALTLVFLDKIDGLQLLSKLYESLYGGPPETKLTPRQIINAIILRETLVGRAPLLL